MLIAKYKNNMFMLMILLLSCEPAKNNAENTNQETTKKTTCKANLKVLERNNLPSRTDVYVSVNNFNPKSKDCWNALTKYVDGLNHSPNFAYTYHFMDLETFTLPETGIYTEETKKKVIAQYVILDNGKTNFFIDPLGYGIYTNE